MKRNFKYNGRNKMKAECEAYFCVEDIRDYEELGRWYASVEGLTYKGDKTKVDMHEKYAELGKAVCEMYYGKFLNGNFIGQI